MYGCKIFPVTYQTDSVHQFIINLFTLNMLVAINKVYDSRLRLKYDTKEQVP